MLSTVLPPISACTPQELLPIIPPSVQRLCVAGSGAKVRSCFFGGVAQRVEHDAGLDAGELLRRVELQDACMYFEKSRTTATLQHWPARLVPPPRESTGAPNSRHAATVARRRPHRAAEPAQWALGGSWRSRWRRARGRHGRSGPRRAPLCVVALQVREQRKKLRGRAPRGVSAAGWEKQMGRPWSRRMLSSRPAIRALCGRGQRGYSGVILIQTGIDACDAQNL